MNESRKAGKRLAILFSTIILTIVTIAIVRAALPKPRAYVTAEVTGHQWMMRQYVQRYALLHRVAPYPEAGAFNQERTTTITSERIGHAICDQLGGSTSRSFFDTYRCSYYTYDIYDWEGVSSYTAETSGNTLVTERPVPTVDITECPEDAIEVGCLKRGNLVERLELVFMAEEFGESTCRVTKDMWLNTPVGTQITVTEQREGYNIQCYPLEVIDSSAESTN